MMDNLFTGLSGAIEGVLPVALAASFAWGILSILLSPCHLGSLPLIVGFISGQQNLTTRRAFVLALMFGLGVLITIALIGIATAALGRMMGDVGPYGDWLVAAVLIAVGLYLLGIIPQLSVNPAAVKMQRRGLLAAFILGLVFGVALGPCTFAYMAPILAIAFRVGVANLLTGVLLLTFYGLGHTAVIVAAGTSAQAVQRFLNWNEESKGVWLIKRVCGILVIGAGLYIVLT